VDRLERCSRLADGEEGAARLSVESRPYVAAFLEDSLGLVYRSLDPERIPSELVDRLASAVRGSPESATSAPDLEGHILRFLADLEAETLERSRLFVRKARWPQNAQYAACVTHDVDNVRRPMAHILRRANRFSFPDMVLALLGLKSLYNNIDLISDLEAKQSLRSSFYFLSKNYDLRALAPTARRLVESGWEVGLHGDFGTHDSMEAMRDAVTILSSAFGKRPVGLREHYLHFDYGRTWEIAQSLGFIYDSTVGNRDRLGFRVGLCTPFHPPDSGWKQMKVVELPLVLMDTTLWGYLGRSEKEGEMDFLSLLDQVKRVSGLMTLLWHQESVRMKGGRIYPRLLAALAGRDCYAATGEGIAHWWVERGSPLVSDDTSVRMDGAPEGMVLTFKTTEKRTLTVEGGILSPTATGQTVTASGGPLRVMVSQHES
jgi:peptidoglycan/xylan/chitin deacetylase (PgdA/CDA1 family)